MAMGGERAPPRPKGERALRVASYNVNGMSVECKRKEVLADMRKGKLDVLGVQETHMKGCGVMDCMEGSECELWEGMKGGVVWCGIDEKIRGRGK